jgi:hypothetical protein
MEGDTAKAKGICSVDVVFVWRITIEIADQAGHRVRSGTGTPLQLVHYRPANYIFFGSPVSRHEPILGRDRDLDGCRGHGRAVFRRALRPRIVACSGGQGARDSHPQDHPLPPRWHGADRGRAIEAQHGILDGNYWAHHERSIGTGAAGRRMGLRVAAWKHAGGARIGSSCVAWGTSISCWAPST